MIEMKQPFGCRICTIGLMLAALCLAVAPAFAQNSLPGLEEPTQGGKAAKPPGKVVGAFDKVEALPPGGPAPRLSDGHVDLSGRYYPNSAGRMLEGAYPVDPSVFRQYDRKATPEERPVFKPGMEAKYKSPVPYGICDQAGTPSTITIQENQHGPIVLVAKPGMVILLAEYPLAVRMINTTGRPHDKDPDPTFNGDTSAHYEGDTLVAEAIDIDTRMRNIAVGFPGEGGAWLHSEKERVIERFTRPSKNYLIYQVTIDDPVVLAKPWTSAPRKWTLSQDPNDEWQEYFCTHNEEPEEYKKLGSPSVEVGGRGR